MKKIELQSHIKKLRKTGSIESYNEQAATSKALAENRISKDNLKIEMDAIEIEIKTNKIEAKNKEDKKILDQLLEDKEKLFNQQREYEKEQKNLLYVYDSLEAKRRETKVEAEIKKIETDLDDLTEQLNAVDKEIAIRADGIRTIETEIGILSLKLKKSITDTIKELIAESITVVGKPVAMKLPKAIAPLKDPIPDVDEKKLTLDMKSKMIEITAKKSVKEPTDTTITDDFLIKGEFTPSIVNASEPDYASLQNDTGNIGSLLTKEPIKITPKEYKLINKYVSQLTMASRYVLNKLLSINNMRFRKVLFNLHNKLINNYFSSSLSSYTKLSGNSKLGLFILIKSLVYNNPFSGLST
jgi:hypothetical protein